MKQCTALVCKETFAFKINGKGKTVTFKQGQPFWVKNTEVNQNNTNIVTVARKGKSIGYDFTPQQINQFFMVSTATHI